MSTLTQLERSILRVIAEKGTILSVELCKIGWRAPQTISRALASLREKGLIKKVPDLTDMRRSYYTLSDEAPLLYQ